MVPGAGPLPRARAGAGWKGLVEVKLVVAAPPPNGRRSLRAGEVPRRRARLNGAAKLRATIGCNRESRRCASSP
jgi:hypothetical protein